MGNVFKIASTIVQSIAIFMICFESLRWLCYHHMVKIDWMKFFIRRTFARSGAYCVNGFVFLNSRPFQMAKFLECFFIDNCAEAFELKK